MNCVTMGRLFGCYWREVVYVDDLSQYNDPAGGKIFRSEAVLGSVQIRSSTVKCENFGKFQIFFELFLVFIHIVIRFPDKFSASGHFCAVRYDDAARPKCTKLRLVSVDFYLGVICDRLKSRWADGLSLTRNPSRR